MSDWHTLEQACEAKITIHRSRFIAFIVPVSDPAQAASEIAVRSHEFEDATHNCYAWVTGFKREQSYYSDAGEPAGTAGKPILNALLSAGLTNVAATVTRYYGGVKLGVRGLIEAYSQSVEEALKTASLVPAIPMSTIWITSDYSDAESAQRLVQKLGGGVVDIRYEARVETILSLPERSLAEFCEFLDGRGRQNGLVYRLKEQ
ncbi:MAG TPA: YigZ family protein [Candidatus Cloacimonadota bacterium]|nr:YigZ family protein [Candidatus Cloacimonadota bacterium]